MTYRTNFFFEKAALSAFSTFMRIFGDKLELEKLNEMIIDLKTKCSYCDIKRNNFIKSVNILSVQYTNIFENRFWSHKCLSKNQYRKIKILWIITSFCRSKYPVTSHGIHFKISPRHEDFGLHRFHVPRSFTRYTPSKTQHLVFNWKLKLTISSYNVLYSLSGEKN